MTKSDFALIIPLVLSAAPALAATETPASCDARFETVSAAWTEMKEDMSKSGEVAVTTEEGAEEVEATDAKPTENWFGKPPSVETVDGYLEQAREAMQAGDTEMCLAQLDDVDAAIAESEGMKTN